MGNKHKPLIIWVITETKIVALKISWGACAFRTVLYALNNPLIRNFLDLPL